MSSGKHLSIPSLNRITSTTSGSRLVYNMSEILGTAASPNMNYLILAIGNMGL